MPWLLSISQHKYSLTSCYVGVMLCVVPFALLTRKPHIFAMIQRCGQVVIQIHGNGCQITIEPLMKVSMLPGTLIYTDGYGIYARLKQWGYRHKSVNHGSGEYARDAGGFYEVNVNTMEAFGLCCAVGCGHTVGSHKKSFFFMSKNYLLEKIISVFSGCDKYLIVGSELAQPFLLKNPSSKRYIIQK
jgi:ISXO2-like transposase domain